MSANIKTYEKRNIKPSPFTNLTGVKNWINYDVNLYLNDSTMTRL